jgi:hypothetical protein
MPIAKDSRHEETVGDEASFNSNIQVTSGIRVPCKFGAHKKTSIRVCVLKILQSPTIRCRINGNVTQQSYCQWACQFNTFETSDTRGIVIVLNTPFSPGHVLELGEVVGTAVGMRVGKTLGNDVGVMVGEVEGEKLGALVGTALGDTVGETVGTVDGSLVGEVVGSVVGPLDGTLVGTTVGKAVGTTEG